MKKSFKKILFAILTVFAVCFVVACGNKENTKINKEEVLKKSVETINNIKSGNKLVNTIMEVKGGVTVEYIIDKETYFPKALSLSFETKIDDQDVKVTTTNSLSNINSVGEIIVPEEALNSSN